MLNKQNIKFKYSRINRNRKTLFGLRAIGAQRIRENYLILLVFKIFTLCPVN
jgi:hypothetical protein